MKLERKLNISAVVIVIVLILLTLFLNSCKKEDEVAPPHYTVWNFDIEMFAILDQYPYDTIYGTFFSDRPTRFRERNITHSRALFICDSITEYQRPPKWPYDNSVYLEIAKVCTYYVDEF